MKRSSRTSVALAGALIGSGWAYGQQPPDVVTSDGYQDTAVGTGVLKSISPGFIEPAANRNTGVGAYALLQDTTGSGNTAVGAASLSATTTGGGNTAVGNDTLTQNITGSNNTATGLSALAFNTSGIHNTANGAGALFGNTTGQFNTASGDQALSGGNNLDMTGNYNTADGAEALFSNTTGQQNTAAGSFALTANLTGNDNLAIGANALALNESGSNNIAIGYNAGYYVRGGLFNIEIGNVGNVNDQGVIRIGTASQQGTTYISGIANAKVTGSAVYITSTGQLGVLASSERYKTAIAPMGGSTERLRQLRAVTFHLKTEPKGPVQYGLIAEEVARVYPELVIRDEKGQVQGVRYEELAPMLLNEVQRQASELRQLKQEREHFATRAEMTSLKQQLQAALEKLQSTAELVAKR
jgi:hypothetical protein